MNFQNLTGEIIRQIPESLKILYLIFYFVSFLRLLFLFTYKKYCIS